MLVSVWSAPQNFASLECWVIADWTASSRRRRQCSSNTSKTYSIPLYPVGKSGLTDMVCYKRLSYMVGFLRPRATTGWTTFPIGYCRAYLWNSEWRPRWSPYFQISILSPIVFILVVYPVTECNALRRPTSGFVDDVMFSHWGRIKDDVVSSSSPDDSTIASFVVVIENVNRIQFIPTFGERICMKNWR